MDKLTRVVDNLAMPGNIRLAESQPLPSEAEPRPAVTADSSGAVSRSEAFFRVFPISERDRKWGFYVTTVGTGRIAPHSPYPPVPFPQSYHYTPAQTRVLHEYQMTYISRGSGVLETQASGRHRIEAGHLYILFPGIWHREEPDPERGWNEHYLGFYGEVARRMLGRRFFSPKEPVIKIRHEEALLELYTDAIGAVKTNQPALQQILAGIGLNILGIVYSGQHYKIAGDDRSLARMHTAVTSMREALTAQLNLGKLARDLGMSYTSFRHKFAHHTGMSPHQYLLELRLARARKLLMETALSTKEVAHLSGFEDEHYFCRFFHRKLNATPTEWRARATRNRRPSSPARRTGRSPARGTAA
jgi:AraC-like DNA-binding protein